MPPPEPPPRVSGLLPFAVIVPLIVTVPPVIHILVACTTAEVVEKVSVPFVIVNEPSRVLSFVRITLPDAIMTLDPGPGTPLLQLAVAVNQSPVPLHVFVSARAADAQNRMAMAGPIIRHVRM